MSFAKRNTPVVGRMAAETVVSSRLDPKIKACMWDNNGYNTQTTALIGQ
jgi:hypothetical protein